MSATVLVTGSQGFTGRYVVDELHQHGFQVLTLESDLLNLASLEQEIGAKRPDFVIHLAAESRNFGVPARRLVDVNVSGTLNLLDALLSKRPTVQKVILASSAAVYGVVDGDGIVEDSSLAPVSLYGCSKLLLEFSLAEYSDNFEIIVTRPFNYTGRGQSAEFVVPKLIEHAKRSDTVRLGNISVAREFNDVRDVAHIYRRLLDVESSQLIVNVCSSRPYRIEELISQIEASTGKRLPVSIDEDLIRPNDPPIIFGSNARLLELVPDCSFRPLSETIDWMLDK